MVVEITLTIATVPVATALATAEIATVLIICHDTLVIK